MRGASFKIGLSALCAFLLAAPAHGQKTKAELSAEVSTTFPDNTAGLITPAGMRAFQNDLINSIMPTAPVVSGNLACFNGTTGLLKDCGATDALTVGTTTIAGGTSKSILFNNAGVLANTNSAAGAVLTTDALSNPSLSPNPVLGLPGFTPGSIGFANATSGTVTLQPASGALGSAIATLPAGTYAVVGDSLTQTLTNKTFDTGGTGNSLLINGVAANANTGTGAVARANSPAFVTPDLGTPTAATLTNANGLPLSGLNTQAANTIVANATGSSASPTAVDISTLTAKASPASSDLILLSDQAASGALKKVTVSSLASAGSVGSLNGLTGALSIVAGQGVSVAPAGSNITVAVNQSVLTDSLAADVNLNNTANYFDGPSVAQGTSGTWFASGTVTVFDTANASVYCKLWDGTTVIASAATNILSASAFNTVPLSGYIAAPAGNIRISCRDITNTSGKMLFNQSGNSKDSTISAVRVQ